MSFQFFPTHFQEVGRATNAGIIAAHEAFNIKYQFLTRGTCSQSISQIGLEIVFDLPLILLCGRDNSRCGNFSRVINLVLMKQDPPWCFSGGTATTGR